MPSLNVPSSQNPANWDYLISKIADNRDEAAFSTLYVFYAPRVKAMFLKQGLSVSLAEELAQETLIVVWRKASSYKSGQASVGAWIYTIARNKRIDRYRKDKRNLSDFDDYETLLPMAISPETETAWSFAKEHIANSLDQLPKEQRDVLLLSFMEEKPHGDVSEALNIPLGTVKSRIRLGMKKLRELLKDERNTII